MSVELRNFEGIGKLIIQKYERYLPTAFDESLSLLEKVNKVIEYCNQMGLILNDVVDQWNEVMEWVLNEGLSKSVNDRLDEMAEDGTLEKIINENIFSELNNKINDISVSINSNHSFQEIQSILNHDLYSNIIFKAGIYELENMDIVLKGDREWVFDGQVTFNYNTPTSNGYILNVDSNGHGLSLKGNLVLDGKHHARGGLSIYNNVISDSDLHLSGIKAVNFFSRTMGQASFACSIRGSFNNVSVYNSEFKNVSRLSGVGVPQSQGSTGLHITSMTPELYTKNLVIENIVVENISNQESHSSDYDVDCDGLSALAPLDNAMVVDGSTLINNSVFINCKGRSIKSQRTKTIVSNCIFKRNSERSIRNGREIDLQRSGGYINNIVCEYQEPPNGETPFGQSFIVVRVSSRNQPLKESSFIGNMTIKNDASFQQLIPYVVSVDNRGGGFDNVVINNIQHTGVGRISNFLHGTLDVGKITLQNVFLSALIRLIDNNSSRANIMLINVTNGNVNFTPTIIRGLGEVESVGLYNFDVEDTQLNNIKTSFLNSDRLASFHNKFGNNDLALGVYDGLNETLSFGVRGSGALFGRSYISADYHNNFLVPWSIKTSSGPPTGSPERISGNEAIGVSVYSTTEEKIYVYTGGGVWKGVELS